MGRISVQKLIIADIGLDTAEGLARIAKDGRSPAARSSRAIAHFDAEAGGHGFQPTSLLVFDVRFAAL